LAWKLDCAVFGWKPHGRLGRASGLGYALLLPYLGHPFAGTLVALIVLRVMGLPRWPLCIGIAIAVGSGSYYLFGRILDVPLPMGFWLD
jgi:putative tricarboxylic transport membrane protein